MRTIESVPGCLQHQSGQEGGKIKRFILHRGSALTGFPDTRGRARLLTGLLAAVAGFFSVAAQAADTLPSGTMLGKGQAVVSADNNYMAAFQDDGNFVLYDLKFKRPTWASNTSGKTSDRIVMQSDGNLVIYNGTSAVWASNTAGKGGAYLKLGTDGNLIMVQGSATVWATNTKADGILPSGGVLTGGPEKQCNSAANCFVSGGNGTYYAVFQSDGNFVIYNSSWGAEWATGTNRSGANKLIMQADGNLVLYQNNTPKWASNTVGNPGAFLVMQKDKNLVMYNTSMAPIWSNTWNSKPHCSTWNLSCRAQKTFSNLADWVKDAASDAAAAAATTTSAVNAVVAKATQLANASVDIAKSEMATIATSVKSAYSASAGAIQSGYNASVAALKAAWNAALEALFRQAGQNFINGSKSTLTSLRTKMKSLDTDGKAAFNRIQRAVSSKTITPQMATDMRFLATKLGMVANQTGSNIPNNVTNSSWGIPLVGVDAGLLVGGQTNLSLAMNIQPDSSGRYTYAIVSYSGGTLGATIGAEAGPNIGINWSPGTISDNEGWSVGFGVSGALGVGASLGLSWNVSKGMSGAANAIPGVSLQSADGSDIDVSFSAGYTKNLVTGTF
ncbi:MAG: hypothetical protein HQL66_05555 [Magnetococcales bacterium]|nr:hypothetical protein [Magnetococcales bacterium]